MALKQLCRIQPRAARAAPAEPAEALLDADLGIVLTMVALIERVVKQLPELEAEAAPVDGHVKVHAPGFLFVPEVASTLAYSDDHFDSLRH
jgi:hypothetical protein